MGIPKGRKNINETDIECAFREFVEETGLTFNDLILIRNLAPYEEIFIGSNYESYKIIFCLVFVVKKNKII